MQWSLSFFMLNCAAIPEAINPHVAVARRFYLERFFKKNCGHCFARQRIFQAKFSEKKMKNLSHLRQL